MMGNHQTGPVPPADRRIRALEASNAVLRRELLDRPNARLWALRALLAGLALGFGVGVIL